MLPSKWVNVAEEKAGLSQWTWAPLGPEVICGAVADALKGERGTIEMAFSKISEQAANIVLDEVIASAMLEIVGLSADNPQFRVWFTQEMYADGGLRVLIEESVQHHVNCAWPGEPTGLTEFSAFLREMADWVENLRQDPRRVDMEPSDA